MLGRIAFEIRLSGGNVMRRRRARHAHAWRNKKARAEPGLL
jgi:hypothetical protein